MKQVNLKVLSLTDWIVIEHAYMDLPRRLQGIVTPYSGGEEPVGDPIRNMALIIQAEGGEHGTSSSSTTTD